MLKVLDEKQNRKYKINLYRKNYYENLYYANSVKKAIFYGVKYISKLNVQSLMEEKYDEIVNNYLKKVFKKTFNKKQVKTALTLLDVGLKKELNNILKTEMEKEVLKYYCDIFDIKTLISGITYKEFINIFPIIKDYSGKKFECKDYFCVLEYLSPVDLNEKIGMNNVDELFWNYFNNDIMFFVVNEISCIDKLNQLEDKPTVLESFLEQIDPQKRIHTYTYDKEENTMQDNVTGEIFKVSKPKENTHLKLVKDEE